MSAQKKDWSTTSWEILTATCRLGMRAEPTGKTMSWNLAVVGERGLVSGQFTSSGNVNTDLKIAQSEAIAALNAFTKTIATYAAEIASL